jgi:hypothetical protein
MAAALVDRPLAVGFVAARLFLSSCRCNQFGGRLLLHRNAGLPFLGGRNSRAHRDGPLRSMPSNDVYYQEGSVPLCLMP